MAASQAVEKIIREPGFATRLTQACDASPHCPPLNRGRLTWLRDELNKAMGKKMPAQTVSHWFAGEQKPRHATSVELAKLLGVDSNWLYMGLEPDLSPRERQVRNAMVDGSVNVIAGLIQMDGGHPAFPDENDARAQQEHIDLYAVIKGANYAIHVALVDRRDEGWVFKVPLNHQNIVVLGVIRSGFTFSILEITKEMIEEHGEAINNRTINVTLDEATIEANKLESFSKRI